MPRITETEQICSTRELSGRSKVGVASDERNGNPSAAEILLDSEFYSEQNCWGERRNRNVLDFTQRQAARRIEPSLNYMLHHLNESLRVSTLSEIAGVSASHFFWLFKLSTGYAPIDFFIRLRMHHACELLQDRSLTIKEIAGTLGYNDPFYFSRIFKSVTGVAPRDYRTTVLDSRHATSASANSESAKTTLLQFVSSHKTNNRGVNDEYFQQKNSNSNPALVNAYKF